MKKLLAAVTVVAVSTAQAATIHVDIANCPGPGDGSVGNPYCSIQTAIDNAVDTDEIVVAPGAYFEAIDFLGKAITLRSSDGRDVTIIDAQQTGSVVSCYQGEGPDTVLEGLTITGGLSGFGGGMYNDGSSPTVISCIFVDNLADNGGGIFNWDSNPTVIDCIFDGIVAFFIGGGGFGGGGIFNWDSNPMVIGCTFRGNIAVFQTTFGGAMYNDNSNPTILNCLFDANVGSTGSGMYNLGSSLTITNCTFTGNFGDVIRNSLSSNAVLTNCVLWGNPFSGQIVDTLSSPSTVSYSNVQGGWSGLGSNNIDADPLFASTSDCCVFHFNSGCEDADCTAAVCNVDPLCCDDAHNIWNLGCLILALDMCSVCPVDTRLQSGSPCIDAGDNRAVPRFVLRDLDGNPRFVADACAGDSGATVDMGAYEFQGTSCDLGTMLEMLAAWGRCTDCRKCRYDFDGDCSVGILDLLILLGNWTL